VTVDDGLSALLSRGLVRTRPPADMLSPDSLLGDGGAVLPLDHARLLSLTNGLDAYGGYFRLFGLGPWSVRDMRRWNAESGWRAAWDGRADGWWCFGETAWGDQYAYARGDDPFTADSTVYRLDASRLEPEAVAEDFTEFLVGELARNAAAPRDDVTVAARERFGEIDPNQQLAYVPSLLLGGAEDLANLATLGAREAMAAAGETYSAWARTAVAN
jgi:hypothetical protein